MNATDSLHITSGDCAAGTLKPCGLPGSVFVWHDILYEGTHNPGWPVEETLLLRARLLADATGGGVSFQHALQTLRGQYDVLRESAHARPIVLWFDACLFDQSMLVHILACLKHLRAPAAELICIDACPGMSRYNGLGELTSGQLADHYPGRIPVTPAMVDFAATADAAFARQDVVAFRELAQLRQAPLPWIPAVVARWLQEIPAPETGLGRLEQLAWQAIRDGATTPLAIFKAVAAQEPPPQYWGDTTLWQKINGLAAQTPPLVRIAGPTPFLPQWPGSNPIAAYTIRAVN